MGSSSVALGELKTLVKCDSTSLVEGERGSSSRSLLFNIVSARLDLFLTKRSFFVGAGSLSSPGCSVVVFVLFGAALLV